MNDEISDFIGFTPKTIGFLKAIGKNNNSRWFKRHREDYEKCLLGPMKALVMSLGQFMLSIDSDLVVKPAVNKTISRIYRDTRFSKDKRPLRDRMWFTFKRQLENWPDAPAYFFELTSDFYRYGMGFYDASPTTMRKFRTYIDENKNFLKEIGFSKVKGFFDVEGEEYKRAIGEDKSRDIRIFYRRKNVYLIRNEKIPGKLFSGKLLGELSEGFKMLEPLYSVFWKLKFMNVDDKKEKLYHPNSSFDW